MKKSTTIIPNFLVFAFIALILLLSIRENLGNPTAQDLNKHSWKENGPFELSPKRGSVDFRDAGNYVNTNIKNGEKIVFYGYYTRIPFEVYETNKKDFYGVSIEKFTVK